MRKRHHIPSTGSSASPLFLCALITLAVTSSRSHASGYSIVDLGPADWFSHALAINQYGQIAGDVATYPPDTHASLYDVADSSWRDLGALGTGRSSVGFAVNNLGHVVGYSDISYSSTERHPFFYDGTRMIDLGSFGGDHAVANAINDADIIVGRAEVRSGDIAFLYDGTRLIDLGGLGGSDAGATGINNSGLVVGYCGTPTSSSHAFLYDSNTREMRDLGTLPGTNYCAASVINNADPVQIAGFCDYRVFLYSEGIMTDLGQLPGRGVTYPMAMNDLGFIVGVAGFVPGDAWVYDGTEVRDLNELIPSTPRWHLIQARGINNAGQIVGIGTKPPDIFIHGFLLNPNP